MPRKSVITLSVSSPRLLSESEAAAYVNLPLKVFRAICPARRVELAKGQKAVDQRDLDAWIDAAKAGDADPDDALLERLK